MATELLQTSPRSLWPYWMAAKGHAGVYMEGNWLSVTLSSIPSNQFSYSDPFQGLTDLHY